jgi:hypothetical protein
MDLGDWAGRLKVVQRFGAKELASFKKGPGENVSGLSVDVGVETE